MAKLTEHRTDVLGLGGQPPIDYFDKNEVNSIFSIVNQAKRDPQLDKQLTPEEEALFDEPVKEIHPKETERQSYFVWDIETYKGNLTPVYLEYLVQRTGRLTDPKKIKAKQEEIMDKLALSPRTGQIILSGFLTESGEYESLGLDDLSEKVIVDYTLKIIAHKLDNGSRLVTYNGIEFDVKYLMHRALLLGIDNYNIPFKSLTHKYNNFFHFDCYNELGDGSLASWGYLLGLTNSFGTDGAEIGNLYEAKEYDKIKSKNKKDLILTSQIYEKLRRFK